MEDSGMNVQMAWSWSRYADYKQCPLRYKLKYIDKLPDPGGPAMQRGDVIHKKAEGHALGRTKVLPPELNNFAAEFKDLQRFKDKHVEQNWAFRQDWSWTGRPDWFGTDVWLRAKADLVVLYGVAGEVIDHKTGKKYATNEEQVDLMILVTSLRFPQLKSVRGRLWYLDIADDNEREVLTDWYDEKDFANLQSDWDKKVVPMFVDQKFAPKPNDKCRWCIFSNSKGGPCKF